MQSILRVKYLLSQMHRHTFIRTDDAHDPCDRPILIPYTPVGREPFLRVVFLLFCGATFELTWTLSQALRVGGCAIVVPTLLLLVTVSLDAPARNGFGRVRSSSKLDAVTTAKLQLHLLAFKAMISSSPPMIYLERLRIWSFNLIWSSLIADVGYFTCGGWVCARICLCNCSLICF